jgi:hypothetical protein
MKAVAGVNVAALEDGEVLNVVITAVATVLSSKGSSVTVKVETTPS